MADHRLKGDHRDVEELKRVAAARGESDLLRQARALLAVPEAISKDLTHFTTDPRPMLPHRDQVAKMIERLRTTPAP